VPLVCQCEKQKAGLVVELSVALAEAEFNTKVRC
jgi:hypothetical protein